MRSIEEIGSFENSEVQKWYSIYASMYLDFVDDNLNHFFTRCMDLYPIRNCEDRSKWPDLYKEAAKQIYDETKNCYGEEWWNKNYPELELKEEITA